MTVEELEKRVKALEDLDDIKNMHRQYIYWLTTRSWDEMMDCFVKHIVNIRNR